VRSTSIDELPQLWNVLTGDMSLIGPRPLLKNFLYLYDKKQMHRHDVRPGITGWAQVNGRNLCTYSKKFEYDLWYVNHISFTLDLKIILMTISNVLRRDDIGEGSVNNEEVDDLQFTERLEEMGLREE
jgi:lipopolysaccharide/colanic/teichoic acid biosynthesis glycosyltransferase